MNSTWPARAGFWRATSIHYPCIRERYPLISHYLLLFALSMPFVAQSGTAFAQAGSHQPPVTPVLTIDAPLHELLDGYHSWAHRHPESVSPNVKILTPSIDVYSPSGISLFHSTHSEKNAAKIRSLPLGIPRGNTAKTDDFRPTLQEALEMFPELGRYKTAPVAKQEYTVFAIAFPELGDCKAQDEAIQEYKRSARGTGVRIIEVRIHK